MAVYVGQAYADEIAQASTLSTVQANKAKVTEITETLRLVYSDAYEGGGGDEVKELMKELRKCQSALKKSIDRKRQEIHKIKSASVMATAAPEMLSALEEKCVDAIREGSLNLTTTDYY